MIRADVTLGLREKIEASLARESSGKLPAEIIDYIAPAHRSLNWWPAAGFTARQYWLKPTGVDTFLLHAYVVQEDTAPHILFVLSPKKIYEEGRNRFK